MERDYKAEAHAHWDFINKMAKRGSGKNEIAEEAALATVFQRLVGGPSPDAEPEAMDAMRKAFQAMNISISSEERLFLKMCYQDGLTVTRAGRLLGMGRFQAASRMRRLLERLRREFERAGLYREILLLLRDAG
ncbi:MAG TPA: hypothetical protein DEB25_08405 [Desulfobulbaceae bacterium]|nr:hypothetical protein [Desulfobulbaceae bacterium]